MTVDGLGKLILASRSAARHTMLSGAGVSFSAQDAGVDETSIKVSLAGIAPDELALHLARAKALAVSIRHPDAWVLGSDQTLDLEGVLTSKAPSLDAARDRLKSMRGKIHHLNSAAALARGGEVTWSGVETARMTMRQFSNDFLESYLFAEGETLLGSVGCYRLEGMGAQLFEQVEGDYFTVLGMPLWSVLAELRKAGVVGT